MNKRVLFSDNGTIKDLSTVVNKYSASGAVSLPFVAAEDAIYIGSRLPFNHTYIKLKTPNTITAKMKVQYFSNQWNDAVELIDETDGLKQSGFVTFVPSRQQAWCYLTESKQVTGLESTVIYDLYWIKITFDADLDVLTEMQWMGNLFSDDYDLGAEYPDLLKTAVISSFKAGKTNWEEQNVRAAEILVDDLITKNIIDDSNQILLREEYKNASVCKVAEIIFGALGDDFVDQKARARTEYERRLVKRIHTVDKNATGAEEVSERRSSSGWLSR